jgi:hypothetical protein
MCVTDLELDLDQEITEDEQAPSPGQPGLGSQPGPDPQPVGGQAPGVAWGRAGQHTAAG